MITKYAHSKTTDPIGKITRSLLFLFLITYVHIHPYRRHGHKLDKTTSALPASQGQTTYTFNFPVSSTSPCSSSIPEYLLIQPSTSRCQTSEFSGFSTHYNKQVPRISNYTYQISSTGAVVGKEWKGQVGRLTWFSSGNTSSLLGTPLACSTLNAARPSVMGSR